MADLYNNQNNKPKGAKEKIVVGLDIGTSKICAIVASNSSDDSNLKILGIGIAKSEGLNRGVVVNIEKTTKAIELVIEQAKQQSGIDIKDVIIGIAGDHIESNTSRGIITINNPTNEISQDDVKRLLDEAKKISLPSDREIIHVLPQDYIIDNQEGVVDPVGMSGSRLESQVNIITGLKSAIKNITTCVERAGLKIKGIVLEPIASGKAVLSDEEREVGVAVVDIGGGTTDIAVYADKIIRYTSVFGIAGNQVTSDVQLGLQITQVNAEKVKTDNGYTHEGSIAHDNIIMVPGISGRRPQEISNTMLCQIIQPRMQEIFEIIEVELKNSGLFHRVGAGGVVITGGTTLLRGTELLAQSILNLPVRIGVPAGITYTGLGQEIDSPIYSTAVGLALWGLENIDENQNKIEEPDKKTPIIVRSPTAKPYIEDDIIGKEEINKQNKKPKNEEEGFGRGIFTKLTDILKNL